MLALAIRGGWPAGLVRPRPSAAADLVAPRRARRTDRATTSCCSCWPALIVGYAVDLARRGEPALARALAVEAAHPRSGSGWPADIHDGVLQVLALVRRRGREIGGEAAELGRLAAEQEQALRALVGSPADVQVGGDERTCARCSTAYASSAVTVSTPATPVLLPRRRAREWRPRSAAALDNVAAARRSGRARLGAARGRGGRAVVVSIRDDGARHSADAARRGGAEGRLGVARRSSGRVRDLGGTMATSTSAPGAGTEVELRVPRHPGTT